MRPLKVNWKVSGNNCKVAAIGADGGETFKGRIRARQFRFLNHFPRVRHLAFRNLHLKLQRWQRGSPH